jgi:hypothetical protein
MAHNNDAGSQDRSASWWHKLAGIFGKKPVISDSPPQGDEDVCCQGQVHIAFRGVADDHMYMAYNRKWPEVRYFRPNGLRVFCAGCRRRLL